MGGWHLSRREWRLLKRDGPRLPVVGDAASVVAGFGSGGGYVRAGDLVFWAIAEPGADGHGPGGRYILTHFEVVGGIPVARVRHQSASHDRVSDPAEHR